MNNFQPATRRILADVERVSGKRIEVLEDPGLPLLATIQMARNDAPFHFLRYKPTDRPLDYFVGHQAGFILRLFANPAERRFDFAPTQAGKETLRSLLTTGVPLGAAEMDALPQFEEMVYQWALLNLRSLPIGMRIDQWLLQSFPEIREQVTTGIAEQQQVNVEVLSRHLGNLSAPSHLLGGNAAYALLADRLLDSGVFAIPYAATGALSFGERLLAIWDRIPAGASHDQQLVDAWAAELGMSGWYEWVPYRP